MALTALDLFKIGIGPSTSHTVRPLRAALRFAQGLRDEGLLDATARLQVELYGSLGATGKRHASDKAAMLSLGAEQPARVNTAAIPARVQTSRGSDTVTLLGSRPLPYSEREQPKFSRMPLPYHPNGLFCRGFEASG